MFSKRAAVFFALSCALFSCAFSSELDDELAENQVDNVDVEAPAEVDSGDSEEKKRKCSAWGQWQTSKCLWPTQAFSSIPKACVALPNMTRVPAVLQAYVESKEIEIFSAVQGIFKLRGISNSPCGYCSRKIKCRARKNGQWQRSCRFRQVQMVNEQCEGSNACVIKPILGACPPPLPMPKRRRHKRHHRKHRPEEYRFIRDSEVLSNEKPDAISDSLDPNVDDYNSEIEKPKNQSQGPPFWHCVRNKDGTQCLCCCGWYFPDAKSGKCVNVRPKDEDSEPEDEEQSSKIWSGLLDFGDENPYEDVDEAVAKIMPTINSAATQPSPPLVEVEEAED